MRHDRKFPRQSRKLRRWLSLVLVLALQAPVTLHAPLAGASDQRAAAAAEQWSPSGDVGPVGDVALISSPDLERPLPEAPEGRFVSSSVPEPVPVKELVEGRTATSDVWVNSDGSQSVRSYALPHYFQPLGSKEWMPIDSEVAPERGRAGRVASKANRWSVSFGPAGSSEAVQQFDLGGHSVTFSPVDAVVGTKPVTERSRVTYSGLWPSTDAVYSVSSVGVDEQLVLDSPDAPTAFGFDVGGATLRYNADNGVDLLVGDEIVGVIPPLTVETRNGWVPAAVAGAAYSLSLDDKAGGGRLTVSISPEWLAGLDKKAFPVVIDPTVFYSQVPTQVSSILTGGSWVAGGVSVGRPSSSATWRAKAYFPIQRPTQAPGTPPWYLTFAEVRANADFPIYGGSFKFYFHGAVEPTTWAGAITGQPLATFNPGDVNDHEGTATTQVAQQGTSAVGTWYGIQGQEGYSFQWPNTVELLQDLSVLYRYYQTPTPTYLVSPTATISTTTPTLEAALTNEPYAVYNFKVSTEPTGSAGTVLESGWIDQRTWQVPAGALSDGVTYYVSISNAIGTPWDPTSPEFVPWATPSDVRSFTIKKRLGGGGPAPTDTVGSTPGSTVTPSEGSPSPGLNTASITVNMTTGNLALTATTHALPTLSGAAGVTLNYDSLGPTGLDGGGHGLYAHYSSGTTPIGQRIDPSVNFSWTGSPMGGIAAPGPVSATWTGTITPGAGAGPWRFGGTVASGTMKIYFDGSSAADVTISTAGGTPTFGNPQTTWVPGTPHQIKVEYTTSSTAGGKLWAWDAAAPAGPASKFVVPTGWLAPGATGLPAGWRLSANPFSGSWTRLEDLGDQAVLHSASGNTLTFTRGLDGSYAPPPGSRDLLTVATTLSGVTNPGDWTLSSEDARFTFGPDGWVRAVTSMIDDAHPAALQYTYAPVSGSAGAPVLTAITDPVGARSTTLCYGGSSCPSGGSVAAPNGMLGRIVHWDGTTTSLVYDTDGRLIRVVNPVDIRADFGYDSTGRLTSVRDPLANEAIAANQRSDCSAAAPSTPTCSTEITYNTDGKVLTVTQPAPTVGATRTTRTYTSLTSDSAKVEITGFNPSSGYASWVRWDSQGRVIEQKDPMGRLTKTIWDSNIDRPLAVIDPAGLQTTTVYDPFTQNLTDSYGPSASTCFNTTAPYLPTGSCTGVPRTQHFYDEGTTGLRGTFWANPYFAGPPATRTTGFGGSQGTPSDPLQCPTGTRVLTCVVWPTLPVTPSGGSIPVTGNSFTWSARFEGSISSPTSFVINLETSQHVTMYVDDVVYDEIDARTANPNYTHTYGAWPAPWADTDLVSLPAGDHRIRIDYLGSTTSANGLWIDWSPNILASRTCAVNMSDAVAWWTGNNNLKAEIGADATGTISYASGKVGNGMQFNYNPVPVPDFPVITNGLTLEAWIKPQMAPYSTAGAVMSRYYSVGHSPNNAYELYLSNYAYKSGSWALDDNSSRVPAEFNFLAPQIFDGNFHHIASTWNGTDAKVYIDGQLVLSQQYVAASQNLNPATGINFRIGGGGLGYYYVGTIDEPAVFRRPLAANEIASIYNAGIAGKCGAPPPVTATLKPMYGLETRTVDPDGKVTIISYTNPANGIGPELGLPTAVTQDPGGLALTTTTSYESPSSGRWLRKTAATLPGGTTTSYTHYCSTNAITANDCDLGFAGAIPNTCNVTTGASQWGLVAQQTDPGPNPTTARVQQFVYDSSGRIAGRRVGPANAPGPWQCTTYDNRGRVTTRTFPGAQSRTVTYSYSVGTPGNPLKTSVQDGGSTITSTVDLLGRIVSYTDGVNRTTSYTYDSTGRATSTTIGNAQVLQSYDTNSSQLSSVQVKINGAVQASAAISYNPTNGRMTGVTYNDGKTLTVTYDAYGNQSSLSFDRTNAPTHIAGNSITRSPAGRQKDSTVETGSGLIDPHNGDNYTYDGAGRLINAHVAGGYFDYSYANSPNCGALVSGGNTYAGMNTNRSARTFHPTTGPTTTTQSCYNTADQLKATITDSGTPNTAFAYDGNGNQTLDGPDTYTWDSADRLQSISNATTTVTYLRDALDRPLHRTVNGAGTFYGYNGYSDTPTELLDDSTNIIQRFFYLPGGVLVTIDASSYRTWSYPDLNGHYIVTTDNNGTATSPISSYDPWGAAVPGTVLIDNVNTTTDLAAYGTNGKLEEHATTKPLILMGARPFNPAQARFTTVDPIDRGCANNYTYSYGDPLNGPDLSGKGWGILGDVWDATGGKVVHELSQHACGIAKIAGYAATALSTAAVVAGVVALTVGTGGVAAVALSVAATGASAIQWGAGAAAHDSAAATNGAIGTALGVLALGTWGAVTRRLYGGAPLGNGLVDGAGLYANASRTSASIVASVSVTGGC